MNVIYDNREKLNARLFNSLKNDCQKCFGFCCVALYFSVLEGFPVDKEAGKPCLNLQNDFSCGIHSSLIGKGLKGCTAYDCFGAGQKVAQITYNGQDWRKVPESAQAMFEVFSIMRQLHEILWYLTEALFLKINTDIKHNLKHFINETEELTYLDDISLMKLDIDSHRDKINPILKKISEIVGDQASRNQKKDLSRKKTIAGRLDLIGADLRKSNLMGMDLRGAFLIAADLRGNDLSGTSLIGADLRDADIRGSNLTESLFITQSQVNAAKGDFNTRLPEWLDYPKAWSRG